MSMAYHKLTVGKLKDPITHVLLVCWSVIVRQSFHCHRTVVSRLPRKQEGHLNMNYLEMNQEKTEFETEVHALSIAYK